MPYVARLFVRVEREFNVPSCGLHLIFFHMNIFCVIIAGSTGRGKTNLMLNLLKREKLLNYNQVCVLMACSMLYQPAYEYLKFYYRTLEQLILHQTYKEVKIAHFFN